jgi:hypothetical protein
MFSEDSDPFVCTVKTKTVIPPDFDNPGGWRKIVIDLDGKTDLVPGFQDWKCPGTLTQN